VVAVADMLGSEPWTRLVAAIESRRLGDVFRAGA
jgi:hypothetical protein